MNFEISDPLSSWPSLFLAIISTGLNSSEGRTHSSDTDNIVFNAKDNKHILKAKKGRNIVKAKFEKVFFQNKTVW
jgi:hypothetical protein